MNLQKRLPLSGIAFVALALIAVAIGGGTPGTDDSVAEIARFYDENEVRHWITSFAFPATVPFLIVFATGLVHPRRPADLDRRLRLSSHPRETSPSSKTIVNCSDSLIIETVADPSVEIS